MKNRRTTTRVFNYNNNRVLIQKAPETVIHLKLKETKINGGSYREVRGMCVWRTLQIYLSGLLLLLHIKNAPITQNLTI